MIKPAPSWGRTLVVVLGVGLGGLVGSCGAAPTVSAPADAGTASGVGSEPSITTTATTATTAQPSTTQAPATQPLSTQPLSTQPSTTQPVAADPAASIVASMDPEEIAGLLLMPMVWGTDADQPHANNRALFGYSTAAEAVDALGLGGVLIMGHNIVDQDQTTSFNGALQAATSPRLLIAVDQEGGTVARVSDGVPAVRSAATFDDPAQVADSSAATAEALADQGFNVVFAPVADVSGPGSAIGNRSFGTDPQSTAAMVSAAVTGTQSAGLAATAKHWPGLGDTVVDSHQQLPTSTRTEAEWNEVDRPPFVAAIDAGVELVMVGHVAVPALDPSGAPASQSAAVIERLRDAGFDGVIVTDALNMGAVANQSPVDAALASLAAGADLLLAPTEPVATRDAIVDALSDGRLDPAHITASAARVVRLQQRLASDSRPN